MEAINNTLPASTLEETRLAIMKFLIDHPRELEPQTLEGLLIYVLHANPDTCHIHERIRDYKTTGELKEFLLQIREPILHSIRSKTTFKETLDPIDTLINENITELKFLYKKVQNLYLKDPELQSSVKEFLQKRDLSNKVLVFLIFLVQSFIDFEDVPDVNGKSKFYMGFGAQDKLGTNLEKDKEYVFKFFTILKAERPEGVRKCFYLEIPRRETGASDIKIQGRFFGVLDQDRNDNLLLPPFIRFIIQDIFKENGLKVIQLRFATKDDFKILRDHENKLHNVPVKAKQGQQIFDGFQPPVDQDFAFENIAEGQEEPEVVMLMNLEENEGSQAQIIVVDLEGNGEFQAQSTYTKDLFDLDHSQN